MIIAKGLGKSFKVSRRKEFKAVENLNFTVRRGEIFGFLGPNGAGKSTTIRMLAGIIQPTEGTALVCGHDVIKEPVKVKESIGVMPESPGFYNEMRAIEFLEFCSEFHRVERSERRGRARALLDEMGLLEWSNKKIKTFSYGMKKRLALAQCLMHGPELLILDEPTEGLDPQGTHAFREMIKELRRKGKTIFLSSHILHEVQQTCQRVGIISKGRLIAVDTIEKLSEKLKDNAVVHVIASQLSESALEKIRRMDGVLFVHPAVDGVNIGVIRELDLSGEINAILVSHGVKVKSIYTSEPDLEEVFLTLIEEEKNA